MRPRYRYRSVFLLFASQLSAIPAALALDLTGASYQYPTLQQAELLKRQSPDDNSTDVCNQVFPGRYSETCQPNSVSNTLCCIIPDEDRPKCVAFFGYGFCCTEHQTCFVDLASNCNSPSSVVCDGGGCCPEFTSCTQNFNQTQQAVRCDIRPELIPDVVFGTTSSITSSTTTTTTTSTSSSSTQTSTDASTTSSETSTATSQPNTGSSATVPLSSGAIAGIVIGAILALVIGIGIGWYVFNYRANRYVEPGLPPLPPAARSPAQSNPLLGNTQFNGAPYTISGYNSWGGELESLQPYKPPGGQAQELPPQARPRF